LADRIIVGSVSSTYTTLLCGVILQFKGHTVYGGLCCRHEYNNLIRTATTNNLSYVAFELRPLGYDPGMGRTAFLFKLWLGTARCDGCLHTTRRTRGGYMSIAVLGLLQFLPKREEKEQLWFGVTHDSNIQEPVAVVE